MSARQSEARAWKRGELCVKKREANDLNLKWKLLCSLAWNGWDYVRAPTCFRSERWGRKRERERARDTRARLRAHLALTPSNYRRNSIPKTESETEGFCRATRQFMGLWIFNDFRSLTQLRSPKLFIELSACPFFLPVSLRFRAMSSRNDFMVRRPILRFAECAIPRKWFFAYRDEGHPAREAFLRLANKSFRLRQTSSEH